MQQTQPAWNAAVADAVAKHFAVSSGELRFECISQRKVLADSSRVSLVYSGDRKVPAVVFEGSRAGDLALRGAERARKARDVLGRALGAAVLLPLESGRSNDRSFVLYPRCTTISDNRIGRRLCRWLIAPEVLRWLREVTTATRSEPSDEELERAFLRPLSKLARLSFLDDATRAVARQARLGLERGTWRPCFTLMHGDLWLGNIMVAPRFANDRADARWWKRFVISDWPGARTRGFAFYDLIRFARSARTTPKALREEVLNHSVALGCEPHQAVYHLSVALADLHEHLEHFPPQRFAEMSKLCVATLLGAIDHR